MIDLYGVLILDMNSLNGPGVPHRHQWRSDIGKKNLATYDARREAMANHLSRNHVVASAICCTRKNCDKIKWEQLEKVFFSDGGKKTFLILGQFTSNWINKLQYNYSTISSDFAENDMF